MEEVTLVLSQDEADAVCRIVGRIAGPQTPVRQSTDLIWDELHPLCNWRRVPRDDSTLEVHGEES